MFCSLSDKINLLNTHIKMELLKFINIPFVSLLALIPSAVASLVCSGNPLLFFGKALRLRSG